MLITLKDLKPEDLFIKEWGTAPTSQWINRPQRGVEIVHLPTKIRVQEESHKSQHRNRAVALQRLVELINEYEFDAKKVNTPLCNYYQESPIVTYTPECCVDSDGFAFNDMHPADIIGDYCPFCGGKIVFKEYTKHPKQR